MKVKKFETKIHRVLICFSESVSEYIILTFREKLESENIHAMSISDSSDSSDSSNYDILITDVSDLCRLAKKENHAFLYYLHENNKCESIDGIPYAVEDLLQIDRDYLVKVYQRAMDIPWTILETERILVREQTESDLDALYEIYKEPEISLFTDNLYEDKERELAYLKDYKKQVYEFCGVGVWALVRKEDNELIGRAGLAFREGYDTPEIGYVIGKKFQRMGYAYEACKEIIRYSFEELEFEEIRVLFQRENIASRKLSQKLDFEYIGNTIIDGIEMENHVKKRKFSNN